MPSASSHLPAQNPHYCIPPVRCTCLPRDSRDYKEMDQELCRTSNTLVEIDREGRLAPDGVRTVIPWYPEDLVYHPLGNARFRHALISSFLHRRFEVRRRPGHHTVPDPKIGGFPIKERGSGRGSDGVRFLYRLLGGSTLLTRGSCTPWYISSPSTSTYANTHTTLP